MAFTKIVSDQIQGSAVKASNIALQAVGSAQLTTTGVVAGSYPYANVTVDDRGRLTAIASGAPPTTITFTEGETPGGTVNGVNTVFTIVGNPVPMTSVKVYRNGLRLHSGVAHDYQAASIAGASPATVTFDGSAIPQTGDIILVDYRS